MIGATLCMFEGMVLLSVGLGKLPPERLSMVYEHMMTLPTAIRTIQIFGSFFIALGFILLFFASRTKPVPKTIAVEQEGKFLNVPYDTLIDFIKQIGDQNPYVKDFHVTFQTKAKGQVVIVITLELHGVPSVYLVLKQIEDTLRNEIENVFAWKNYGFDFKVEGVSIDADKKYFAPHHNEKESPAAEAKETPPLKAVPKEPVWKEEQPLRDEAPDLMPQPREEETLVLKRSDEEVEELIEAGHKQAVKKPNLISRVLWGK